MWSESALIKDRSFLSTTPTKGKFQLGKFRHKLFVWPMNSCVLINSIVCNMEREKGCLGRLSVNKSTFGYSIFMTISAFVSAHIRLTTFET